MNTESCFARKSQVILIVACQAFAFMVSPLWGESVGSSEKSESSAISVLVDAATGISRGGKPYFVKGAGGSGRLDELAARGANSIRTWTTGGLAEILDQSQKLGLTVSAGIWLEAESSWFSYKNPEHCAKQAERVRKEVMLYQHHPALLAWGLGNEVEGDGSNAAFWKQIDRLATLVRELDPAHPTFTTVAGMNATKANGMNTHATQLHFVGINTYGAIFGLRGHLEKMGWKRPWMLTEWGPRGFWESPKSKFGVPLEQTSTEKAKMIRSAYQKAITPDGGCLGSYVFLWGWKFEATSTWFGILTHEGETTEMADALQEMWSSRAPSNRAPSIEPIQGVPKTAVTAGSMFKASVNAADPDGDPLVWHWGVLREQKGHNAGKRLPMPAFVEGTISSTIENQVSVKAPAKPGIYRLHAWIKDGKGHAATANMPFEVQ